jgi:phosphomannomutase
VGLFQAINKARCTLPGRSFVRSSRTENAVRVYAEAQVEFDGVCRSVFQAVYELVGGTGPKPKEALLLN